MLPAQMGTLDCTRKWGEENELRISALNPFLLLPPLPFLSFAFSSELSREEIVVAIAAWILHVFCRYLHKLYFFSSLIPILNHVYRRCIIIMKKRKKKSHICVSVNTLRITSMWFLHFINHLFIKFPIAEIHVMAISVYALILALCDINFYFKKKKI